MKQIKTIYTKFRPGFTHANELQEFDERVNAAIAEIPGRIIDIKFQQGAALFAMIIYETDDERM